MRLSFAAATGMAAALLLAACDSGGVPSPSERQQGGGGMAAPVAENLVDLRVEGLAAGAEAFYFAAGRNEVERAVERSLGAATGRGTSTGCSGGALDYTDFPGGLALHFQQDRLVGWNWRNMVDGDAAPRGTIRLASGEVAPGAARIVAEQSPGFAPLTASTLGEEFALGVKMGGFIANDTVSMLYAGKQCFMR
ncbi:MAG: aspartate-semialdehyde dehydrogenase [Erythrobacter sp.]